MKNRKGMVLSLASLATSLGLVGAGLAFARDDESKLHKAMEKVQAANGKITKNLRTPAAFKKGQKDVVDAAKELSKIGKEVRDEKEPAKEQKKDQKEWTKLMDDYIKACDDFAEAAGKSDATQPATKDNYKKVTATCTACHKDFRKED